MAVNTNSFESGQPSGTAISNANSGGGAGRAIDTTAGTVTYDTAHVHGGTLAMKVDMAAGTTSQVRWLDVADQAGTVGYIRFYLYLTALPSQNLSVAYITDHGNLFLIRVRIRPTGIIDLIDQGVQILGTTTNAVAIGQWVRVEVKVTCSATTGVGQIRIYNSPESLTPTEDLTTTVSPANTGSTKPGGWRFGGLTTTAASDVFWIDDVASSDVDWIGPTATSGLLSVPRQWTGTTGAQDKELLINSTPQNWLIACVAARVIDGSAPLLSLGDVSRNAWTLVGNDYIDAHGEHASAQLQVEIWACPAARYDGWDMLMAYVSAVQITADDVGSVNISVGEIAGMGNGTLTVDSVTPYTASASASIALTAPAPTGGADCLMLAAACADVTTAVTVSGTGWTGLTAVSATSPSLRLASAWREATTTGTCTFTASSGTPNWAGVVVGIKQTGVAPSQPNPAWPATQLQIGHGYHLSTPPSRVRWTDQTRRYLAFDGDRGYQGDLGTAQQGTSTLTIRNDDGAYSPRLGATAVAAAAGTTSTIKVADASAPNIHVSDFFRITHAVLNVNQSFANTSGWTGTGGTFTAPGFGKIVPDGVSATVSIFATTHSPVTAGGVYEAAGLIQNDVARIVNVAVAWYNASATLISTSTYPTPVTAGVLAPAIAYFTAPATAVTAAVGVTMTGTPAATNIMYADELTLAPADELVTYQVTGLSSSAGLSTVTFARADGSGVAPVPTATGDTYTGLPIDLYAPYRLCKTVGTGAAAKTYIPASGWLRDLPLSFADAHWSEVQAQGADAIETLSAANPTALVGEVGRHRNLYAYWPLGDASGSGYGVNASGVSTSVMSQATSKFGAGAAGTADFGAATQDIETDPTISHTSLLGDPGSAWQQTGMTDVELTANKGFALNATDSFPAIAGGVTITGTTVMTHDQINIVVNAPDPTVMIVKNNDPGAGAGGAVIKVSFGHLSLTPQVTVWDKATHAATTTTMPGTGQLAALEWKAWAIVFDRTSWSFYLNGSLVTSGSANLAASFSLLSIGGEADQFWSGRCYPASHAHIAVYGRKLTGGEITQLAFAAILGTPISGEYVYQRIGRKLGTVGWKGARAVNSGTTSVSAEGAPSGSVADLLGELAGWQDGMGFSDATGQLQFRSRNVSYYQTPRAVLGDRPDLGDIPYQPGQQYDYNPSLLYNTISTENTGTLTPGYADLNVTSLVAVDDASAGRYSSRTLARVTRFSSIADAWHMNWWLLARYSTPRQRVGSVVVSAAATSDTSRWAFVCGVEVGDLVTVTRRPIGQPAISIRCRVLSVTPSFSRRDGAVTGQVTLVLAAAPPIVAIANDSTYGAIAGTVLGA